MIKKGKLLFLKKGESIREKYSECSINAKEAQRKEKGVGPEEGQRKFDRQSFDISPKRWESWDGKGLRMFLHSSFLL